MPPKLPEMLYITRLDYARTHAWWVRITAVNRKPGDPRLADSKMFSDGKWGGKDKALRAAKQWRAVALKNYPRPADHRYGVHFRMPPGYGYIRFFMRRYHHRGAKRKVTLQPALVAWLRIEDGKAKATNASIDRWGRKEAMRRVEAWLEKQRRELARRMGISYSKLLSMARRPTEF